MNIYKIHCFCSAYGEVIKHILQTNVEGEKNNENVKIEEKTSK